MESTFFCCLLDALGPELVLEDSIAETHHTPAGSAQSFVFCRFRRR